jgi:L-amino acid N-acyltransferase YncA
VLDSDVRVRAAVQSDAAAIAAVYAPYVTDDVASFETDPPDAAEFARRMAVRPRLPWLVAERGGVVTGYCYGSRHRDRAAYRWSVDVSVYLDRSEHRRGTGRALYEPLLAELRSLGYVNAYAGIALPNDASVGLHEALGFRLVGIYRGVGYKFGAWRDVGWWQRALVAPPVDPPEPAEWAGG